jgi:hypothetical protein
LTFAHVVKQMGVRDSGRSRPRPDDGDRFATERLHPKVSNWRCRPRAAIRLLRFIAEKRSLVFAVGSLHQRRRQQHELSALKLDMHRVPNQGGRQLKIGGSSVE